MKIRGNIVSTTLKPEMAVVKCQNLTEEEKAQARANIGAAQADEIKIIKSTNLLDESAIIKGSYYVGGVLTTDQYTRNYYAVVVSVHGLSAITVSYKMNVAMNNPRLYNYYLVNTDGSGTEFTPSNQYAKTHTIEIPENVVEVRLSINTSNALGTEWNLMVNEGTEALPYEPWFEPYEEPTGSVNAVINVKDFGAKGDGENDDTEAIRSARDAAVAKKKALYFPAGTYMVHGSIEMWSDCEIYGEGSKSIIKKISAVTEELKKREETNKFNVGQKIFTVADVSKYNVGYDCYIGMLWQTPLVACLYGKIKSIDTASSNVTVELYPKFLENRSLAEGIKEGSVSEMNKSGRTIVLSTSFPVFCSYKYSYKYNDDGKLNPLHNVYIHDLSIDGNRQVGEANVYHVSAIHFDDLDVMTNNEKTEKIVENPHENIRLENLNIYNSPADAISVQSGKNVCITNCITENCSYNGVHFGVGTVNGSVTGCKLNADYCGYYDCLGVSSVSLSNNHFEECSNGIGGIDQYTRGLTINGNTFRGCDVGVQAGAIKYPQNMRYDYPDMFSYAGKPNTGITICNNTFYGVGLTGVGVSLKWGDGFTVNGNTFRDLRTAIETGSTISAYAANNIIKDCVAPLSMVVGENPDAPLTYNSAFVGNAIRATLDGTSAAVSIANAENMLVTGNIVTGIGAAVSVNEDTTTGVVTENNIVAAT